jgi:peptidoglycan hydrolase CwlO-like protein
MTSLGHHHHVPNHANLVAVAVAVLSLLGTFYVEATHHDQDNEHRISVLEAHQPDLDKKVDHIQQQVDKLVYQLLGDKPR